MLLIRPDAAQRVTVLGSTRKSEATSPGVNRRSLARSTFTFPQSCPPCVRGRRAFDPLVCTSWTVSSLVFGEITAIGG